MSVAAATARGRSRPRPGLDAQRQKIIDAAVQLFGHSGVASVSISEICAAAQVSRPTFYKCFANKATLLEAIYAMSVFEPVQLNLLKDLGGSLDDPYRLRSRLDAMLDAIFAHANYAELLLTDASNPGTDASRIIGAAFDMAVLALREALGPGRGSQLSDRMLKSVMAACQWLVHDAIKAGLTPDMIEETRLSVWQLVSALLPLLGDTVPPDSPT